MGSDRKLHVLRDLGQIVTGKTPKTAVESYFNGVTPFVTPTDFDGRRRIGKTLRTLTPSGVDAVRSSLVPAESVMVTCIGSDMGKVALSAVASVTNQQINTLVVNPKHDARYVYYNLSGRRAELRALAAGSAQPILNKSSFGMIEIELPTRSEQSAVADVLSALDDRIDLLRQTNATLEAIAQALFKSWFVDFDPVHAKAEGREPEAMDATTATLLPSDFENSELGPIPRGWRLTRIGEIADLVKGCSYKGAGLSDAEGAYMFNLGCFNAKRIFATEKIKRYTGTYRERHAVIEGDLIVANTDMTQHRDILGRPLFVPGGCEPGFVSHHVFKVAPVLPNAAQWKQFLFFAFQQPEFRERAVGYATGTTVLALARDSAEKCPMVDPGEALLSPFSELATPFLSQIANNLQREKTLEQLRDTLLPRLISGKLRLPEAKEAAEDAVA